MFRGYWRYIFTAVVGLAGLILLLRLAWLYSYREFYQPAEQHYSVERYQPARDATKPVSRREQQPPARAYDPHCQQPQSHEDADLCAQWGAVQAVSEANRLTRAALKLGFVGFWVAALGGLLGAIGTAFLIMTFRENRRSADAAHDANRPWLQLEILGVGGFKFGASGASLEIDVRIHNRGASPATNVLLLAQLVPIRVGWYGAATGAGASRMKNIFRRTGNEIGGAMVFPNTMPEESLRATVSRDEISAAEANAEGAMYELAVGVRYLFGDRVGETVYSYTVTDAASAKRTIYGMNDVPPDRIRLVDTQAGYAA